MLYSRPGKRHHIQGEGTEEEEEDGERGEGGKLQCCSTLLATASKQVSLASCGRVGRGMTKKLWRCAKRVPDAVRQTRSDDDGAMQRHGNRWCAKRAPDADRQTRSEDDDVMQMHEIIPLRISITDTHVP